MHRSLLVQLIAIVVVTVGVIAAIATVFMLSVAEPAIVHFAVHGRARTVMRLVHGLEANADRATLARELTALIESDPELSAIDVYDLGPAGPTLTLSTRSNETPALPGPQELARLQAGHGIRRFLPDTDGNGPHWRVLVPLRGDDGTTTGAVRVDLSVARLARFLHHFRLIDVSIVTGFALLVVVLLGLLLERRVVRPVTALVQGMRRVERGERGARVHMKGSGELAFLARSFNSMAAQLEELTAGLEAQVQRAIERLAEKNHELAATNAKLTQAQAEVLRSQRLAAIGQMAATMAHELGTPLNSILGYTQLLLRDDLQPRQAERLRIVESQVKRMIDTIRSVLDRTRDRSGRRSQVAVGALTRDAVAQVEARLQRCGLAVHVDVPEDLPMVPGDPVGLRQVLLNLLDNAIDASAPSSTIVVRGSLVPRQNGRAAQVELAVRDPGYGMSPEQIRAAFEPFYTTKGADRGTGLGLVIVDYIVRAHGGRLDVESAPGAGTVMHVFLPVEG